MASEGGDKHGKIEGFNQISKFVDSLSDEKQKVLIFSITHGNAADQVIEKMQDYLGEGFIILDGGNEHYRNTERRQRLLSKKGVAWIGMGVVSSPSSRKPLPLLKDLFSLFYFW